MKIMKKVIAVTSVQLTTALKLAMIPVMVWCGDLIKKRNEDKGDTADFAFCNRIEMQNCWHRNKIEKVEQMENISIWK